MAMRLRLLLAGIILALSLALLLWGFWPQLRERREVPIPPPDLTLPTPGAHLTTPWPAC